MILTRSVLSNFAYQKGITEDSMGKVLYENTILFSEKKDTYDIFLSHSVLDKKLVLALLRMFNDASYSVYIDWIEDTQLSRANVTSATANVLRNRMDQSRGLVYITTQESLNSRWCPWELGYFDGKSKNRRCCILPVLESEKRTFNGQEYLGLYPYLDYQEIKGGARSEFWVNDKDGKYIGLKSWLDGKEPYVHS